MLETLHQDKGIYVVSRRKYLQTHYIPKEIEKLKKEFDEDVKLLRDEKIKTPRSYTGYITGTTPFGVFVEFRGGLTGMIHKLNINEEWLEKNSWEDILPGMAIEFYVKDVSVKKQKIILTQILRESLWDTIKVKKILKGKVVKIQPFGALIELDEETNGLIQNVYIQKENITLSVGEEVTVKVESVIKDDRKIYLSLIKK
jgi:small subunit ribosomal protein S1